MRRGSVALLVVVLVVLLIGIFGFFWQKGYFNTKPTASNEPSPKVVTNLPEKVNVDELITYQAPNNWIKIENGDGNFKTKDLTYTPAGGVNNGILASVYSSKINSTFEETFKSFDGGGVSSITNKSKLMVDGRQAFSYYEDYEFHRYAAVAFDEKSGQLIHCDFLYGKDLKKYMPDINQFLNSVKFK
jgi:hypothetical protein